MTIHDTSVNSSVSRLKEGPCLIHVICVWFDCGFIFLCPVSCVPGFASFYGLSIFLLPLRCSITFILLRAVTNADMLQCIYIRLKSASNSQIYCRFSLSEIDVH